MKVSLDTNVLLRLIVDVDETQCALALEMLEAAELVAISVRTFCELVWVLDRRYGIKRAGAASAVRSILVRQNVVVDRPAVEAGLAILDAGGDFADGVIAFDGRWLGGGIFLSFDRKAVRLLEEQGVPARLLSASIS